MQQLLETVGVLAERADGVLLVAHGVLLLLDQVLFGRDGQLVVTHLQLEAVDVLQQALHLQLVLFVLALDDLA